ncbi:MAG: hypothetical protein AAGE01_10350 [Pseudomonadota bacterium]
MADRNYGDLTQVTSAASGDGLVLDQGSTTVGITKANLLKPTGSDANTVTGTAGNNGRLLSWNADGDAVDSGIAAADVLTTVDLTADVTGVLPIANGGTGSATAAAARTALGVDAAGTDNSTDVTLAGAFDYLTIAGQVISLGAIDLAADVAGALPVANGGTGVTALSSLDVASFGSGAASNGHVLTADGSGGASFQAASGGGSGDFMADGSVPMTGAIENATGGVLLNLAGTFRTYTAAIANGSSLSFTENGLDFFKLTSNDQARFYRGITTDTGEINSGVADGASAVGFTFDTALSTSGAKIVSFQNNGAEALFLDETGCVYLRADHGGGNNAGIYLERSGNPGDYLGFTRVGTGLTSNAQILMSNKPIGSLSRISFANNTSTITGDNSGILFFNAASVTSPTTATDTHVDGDGNLIVNALTRINGAYTVAGLPTGTLGDMARVTDASSPSVGSTVSGGGAADALVWFNGSNWTVTGV